MDIPNKIYVIYNKVRNIFSFRLQPLFVRAVPLLYYKVSDVNFSFSLWAFHCIILPSVEQYCTVSINRRINCKRKSSSILCTMKWSPSSFLENRTFDQRLVKENLVDKWNINGDIYKARNDYRQFQDSYVNSMQITVSEDIFCILTAIEFAILNFSKAKDFVNKKKTKIRWKNFQAIQQKDVWQFIHQAKQFFQSTTKMVGSEWIPKVDSVYRTLARTVTIQVPNKCICPTCVNIVMGHHRFPAK